MSDVVQVVTGVLRNAYGEFFLGRRSEKAYNGCWETPGGKVDPGESYTKALEREWWEELRLSILVGRKLSEVHLTTRDLTACVVHVYEVTPLNMAEFVRRMNGGAMGSDHDMVQWMSGSEILALAEDERVPSLRPIVEALVSPDQRQAKPYRGTFAEFQVALEPGESTRRSLPLQGGHVLFADQFNRNDIDALCQTATQIRTIAETQDGSIFLRSLLAGKRILNLFAQPSTRTCESFAAAAEKMGASVRVISDLKASSFAKGESVEDAVRTLASFFDVLVVRHPDPEFVTRAAWASSSSSRPVPVISAGSGALEHPTQALLDVYTLKNAWHDGIDHKRVLLVGDIGRNRAARSLALLLAQYQIARIDIACPTRFPPDQALLDALHRTGVEVVVHPDVGSALYDVGQDIDALYMTRPQREWDAGPSDPGASDGFVLHPEYWSLISPKCLIMHPLPRVNELPSEWEAHPGFAVWDQVRNGVWMRAALLAHIFGVVGEISRRWTTV